MSASCSHLNDFLCKNGSDSYNLIHSFFISCIAKGSRQRKANDCFCKKCYGRKRIYACLDCPYFGCYPDHIQIHSEELQHNLAVETSYGAVYCFICKDYMYHSELISIGKRNKIIEAKVYGTYLYYPWQPTSEEMQLVKKLTGCENKKLSARSFSGLRGIYNFGNTCYISCIVQVLVHTPLLRDYFLSDKHVCKLESGCMVCEMISVCQKFYSGHKHELVLEKLLFLVFKTATEFSDHGQHDAHEFFLKFIDVMCMHSRGITESSMQSHCDCIFHKTFSSLIWEDTMCKTCSTFQNLRSEESPFCLSLNLDTEGTVDGKNEKKKTVETCLRKFTSKQPSEVTKYCENCKEHKTTCTQRSIRRLPIVASLHLQRMLHIAQNCGTADVSAVFFKNSEFVEFKDCLDLSKFVSCDCREPHTRNPEPVYSILDEYDKRFSLYAVVCHSGNEENGHYVSYVKLKENEWYVCDDSEIKKVDPSIVFKAEGYILFYHKKILEYDVDIL